MSFLSNLLSSSLGSVVKSTGNAIDKIVTSDEERLVLKNKLKEIENAQQVAFMKDSMENEKEITKRWLSDNENIVTRLVRPISYSIMMILFISIVLADGNIGEFHVREAYIPVIEALLITMTFAYFGSRGAEKITKILGTKKTPEQRNL